jgi:hypothetical protein
VCSGAIEEAERTRTFGIAGLHSLTALEREEQRLGVQRDDPDLDSGNRSRLQTAWERAEMARAEIASQHPQLNAQALVSIVSGWMRWSRNSLPRYPTPQRTSMMKRERQIATA